MKRFINRYKTAHGHKKFYYYLAGACILFGGSLLANYAANRYTASHVAGAVPLHDLFLDILPVMNVDDVVFEGALFFVVFALVVALQKPLRLPFVLKSFALFYLTRSFFMILTHSAPPLHESYLPSATRLDRLVLGSGDDLFFSGHTGAPFLMALLYWDDIYLRVIFVLTSLIFGTAVLLGHLHYSIDVFAAFFITYGIYHLARRLFKREYELFSRPHHDD